MYGTKNWKNVSSDLIMASPSVSTVVKQWHMPTPFTPTSPAGSGTKRAWTPEEDALIIKLVQEHGTKNWSAVAAGFPGRIGKQCRERWYNHLDPRITNKPWTRQEDLTLLKAHEKYGNRWKDVARLLPGRTENSIKNHWNATVRRAQRAIRKKCLDSGSKVRELSKKELEEIVRLTLKGENPDLSPQSPAALKKRKQLEARATAYKQLTADTKTVASTTSSDALSPIHNVEMMSSEDNSDSTSVDMQVGGGMTMKKPSLTITTTWGDDTSIESCTPTPASVASLPSATIDRHTSLLSNLFNADPFLSPEVFRKSPTSVEMEDSVFASLVNTDFLTETDAPTLPKLACF